MRYYYFNLRLISFFVLFGIFLLNDSCKSGKKSQEGKEVGLEDFLTEEDIFDDIDTGGKLGTDKVIRHFCSIFLIRSRNQYNNEICHTIIPSSVYAICYWLQAEDMFSS